MTSTRVAAGCPPSADLGDQPDQPVEAARAHVHEPGELKFNAVAKACGIGQGTLYRHVRTTEDLLTEVYRHDVEDLAAHNLGTIGEALEPLLDDAELDARGSRLLSILVDGLRARARPRRSESEIR